MAAPPPRPSSATERKKLIEEYEQSKRTEAERQTAEAAQTVRRRRTTRLTAMGVLLAVLLVLAFRPPAWILPPPPPVPTAAEREASVRFSIFLQAQQVDHFRNTRGRLPATLSEAGTPIPGIQYLVQSATSYQLRSIADNSIAYNSTDSLHAFLGESMAHLGPSE
jgi:hypothetical protein